MGQLSHNYWAHTPQDATKTQHSQINVKKKKKWDLKEGNRTDQPILEKIPEVIQKIPEVIQKIPEVIPVFPPAVCKLWVCPVISIKQMWNHGKKIANLSELISLANENTPSEGPRKASPKAISLKTIN